MDALGLRAGVHHDGSVVEAYYNPVTGEAVRYNRINVNAPPVSVAHMPVPVASAASAAY